jgi:hypothetical protein
MIAELAACNAAYAVIKAALANGKELSAIGGKVFDYFDNKAKIQEKATQKAAALTLKNSWRLSNSGNKKNIYEILWSTLVAPVCGMIG